MHFQPDVRCQAQESNLASAEKEKKSAVQEGQPDEGFFKKLWNRWKGGKGGKSGKKGGENSLTQKGSNDQKKDIYQWSKTCAEVFSIIENKAWRQVDFKAMIQKALSSGVSHIDAHSSFFSQEGYQSVKESVSGEFSGIGVSIIGKALDDEFLLILDVVDGGPAQKAGLKAGDKIIEVNGDKLKGVSSDETIAKLKGQVKSKVNVKYLRNKKPHEAVITRDIIKDQQSVAYHFKPQNVYYLSLKMFADNSAQQVSDLLKKAQKANATGIILDLRRNPGGVLESSIDIAGLFLANKSLVVSTKKRDGRVVSEYFTSTDPVHKGDVPIVILTDNFTASASEILAGALQHYSQESFEKTSKKQHKLMVFLLGTQTFGKGSVQEVIPISNGCALKLTTMLYYMPNGFSIQALGITPDFEVKPRLVPTEEIKWIVDMFGKEKSLRNHITVKEVDRVGKNESEEDKKEDDKKVNVGQRKDSEENDDKDGNEKSWEEKQKDALVNDNQVQAAVNMLTLLTTARKHAPRLVSTRSKALEYLKRHVISDDSKEIVKIS